MKVLYIIIILYIIAAAACEQFIIGDNPDDPYTSSGAAGYELSNINATTNQTDKIIITWEEIAYAEEYRVYRSESTDDVTFEYIGRSVLNSYDDLTALPETPYYYKIEVILRSGRSIGLSEIINGFRVYTPGTGKPEIMVKQGENAIESGTGTFYYGITSVYDTIPGVFVIENTGYEDLKLTGNPYITLTGDDTSHFVIDYYPSLTTIPAKKNATFFISFIPRSEGDKTVTVNIPSNDDATPLYSFSLTGDTYWDKRIDGNGGSDTARGVAIDADDNVYIVGSGFDLVSEGSSYDWWIKKYSPDGVEDITDWNKVINSDNGVDTARAVTIDSNGYIYVVGNGQGLISTDSYFDVWIKKFNSYGSEIYSNWDKKFDFSLYDFPVTVCTDSERNVYVGGYCRDVVSASSSDDWFIKKFSKYGVEDTLNWDKRVDAGYEDALLFLVIDSNDNVYAGGYGYNLVSDTSEKDWWIIKYAAQGYIRWEKKLDGNNGDDVAYAAVVGPDDSIYVAGYGENLVSSLTSYDWWIKKFDKYGNEDTINWDRRIDGEYGEVSRAIPAIVRSGYTDVFTTITLDAGGYVYAGGYKGFDWCIKKFAPNGEEIIENWDKQFDGNEGTDTLYSLKVNSQGVVVAVGSGSNLVATESGNDWWIKSYHYEE